jgi:hypothetical protein
MRGRSEQSYERGLERLKVCELLLQQAADKRRRGELMEALELRAEAFAFSREGSAMLEQAAKERAADERNRHTNERTRTAGADVRVALD